MGTLFYPGDKSFEFADSRGLPVDLQLSALRDLNLKALRDGWGKEILLDVQGFIRAALRANWGGEKLLAVLMENVPDGAMCSPPYESISVKDMLRSGIVYELRKRVATDE